MLTAGLDGSAVEKMLRSGRLSCPATGCEGVLAAWGSACSRLQHNRRATGVENLQATRDEPNAVWAQTGHRLPGNLRRRPTPVDTHVQRDALCLSCCPAPECAGRGPVCGIATRDGLEAV